MKKNILNISLFTLLSAVVLCGCSNDDELTVAATDGTTLTVTARADGFTSTDGTPQTGTPQTRASESGYTTTFTNGDQIGVFAVKDGNVIPDCKNVQLTYDGEKWSGNVIYKYTDATYFAYYPYTADMNDKTSVDAIVTAFNNTVATVTDQSTYAKYTACDLMTASVDAASVSGKFLSFKFSHAMSLIEISLPVQKYKTSEAADVYEYSAPVLNPTFSLDPSGATTIKPYPMGNGIYRYIVPAGTSTVSGAFDIADGKTIEYSKSSLSLSAGNYKRLNVTYSGANTAVVRALAIGDFYYSDGNICPGDASNPPKEGCIGIVYWLGDITDYNYTLLDSQFPGGTHGLVVSLWDMPAPDNGSNLSMLWTYGGYEHVSDWLRNATWSGGSISRPDGFTSIQAEDKMQGYANTVALAEYNAYVESQTTGDGYGQEGNKRVKPVKGLSAFQTAHPAPVSSSGWYWPSVCELKQVCWGQGNSSGTSGKSMLNPKITNVGGTTFGDDDYWSSTEDSYYINFAWCVYFYSGNVYNFSYKYRNSCRVRPLLAF
ncbi:fimbrillin family protein [Bacteroides timonensis]|uniref:fimbrillin family protein n=1 Tax=Bacteroides timonensis TaxID=1470345 RepID=UPI0004AEB9F9|nr:fimbrillin family protein [Bacteroides timonensis]